LEALVDGIFAFSMTLLVLGIYLPVSIPTASANQAILKKGSNTATELYWGSGSSIWNNEGDTASLYNKNGQLVSTLKR
jgi:hypothetical protein